MHVTLYKQLPKSLSKIKIVGTLCVNNGEAFLFKGTDLLAHLKKSELIFINSDGIMLRGFEPIGFDRTGREKLKYQEWYCVYSGLVPQNGA